MASTVSMPLVLEVVGAQLVVEADAAALLAHVDDDAAALLGDHLHRLLELLAAVAAHAAEDVAGDALAVHAHEHRLIAVDVAHDEGDVLVGVDRCSCRRSPVQLP